MDITSFLRRNFYYTGKTLLGSSSYRVIKSLRSQQYLSRLENHAIQRKALTHLIRVAYDQVPYYRKPFQDTGLVKYNGEINLSRFSDLPIMTKEILREKGEYMLNLNAPRLRRIVGFPSGGTTGDPVCPKGDLKYWDWYLSEIRFFLEWMGLEVGMPYLYLWGAPQDLGLQSYNLKTKLWVELLQNRYVLNCRRLSDEIMASFLDDINRLRSHEYMVACANELYTLACFSEDQRYPVKRSLKGISSTTAALTEEMRRTIENVFHCPVYSRYGCREAGDIACECQYQNGLHINPLFSFVEVVDEQGKQVPPGEEGRILVTNLHNELMPLIRYEIQDLGILQEHSSCRCGRNWDSFAQITGRISEQLSLPDGSTFGKVFLHFAMETLTDCRGYQLHQVGSDEVEVHLLSPVPNYLETHKEEVQESYNRLMRCTSNLLKLSYRQVEELEKAPSGKQMVIVNKIKPTSELELIQTL